MLTPLAGTEIPSRFRALELLNFYGIEGCTGTERPKIHITEALPSRLISFVLRVAQVYTTSTLC